MTNVIFSSFFFFRSEMTVIFRSRKPVKTLPQLLKHLSVLWWKWQRFSGCSLQPMLMPCVCLVFAWRLPGVCLVSSGFHSNSVSAGFTNSGVRFFYQHLRNPLFNNSLWCELFMEIFFHSCCVLCHPCFSTAGTLLVPCKTRGKKTFCRICQIAYQNFSTHPNLFHAFLL